MNTMTDVHIMEAEVAIRRAIAFRSGGRVPAMGTALRVAQLHLIEVAAYRNIWEHETFTDNVDTLFWRIEKATEFLEPDDPVSLALQTLVKELTNVMEEKTISDILTIAEHLLGARAALRQAVENPGTQIMQDAVRRAQGHLLEISTYWQLWRRGAVTDDLGLLLWRITRAAGPEADPDDILLAPALRALAAEIKDYWDYVSFCKKAGVPFSYEEEDEDGDGEEEEDEDGDGEEEGG